MVIERRKGPTGIEVIGNVTGLEVHDSTFIGMGTAISLPADTNALLTGNSFYDSEVGIEVRDAHWTLDDLVAYLRDTATVNDLTRLRTDVQRVLDGEIRGEVLPSVLQKTAPRLQGLIAYLRPRSGADIAAWGAVILQAVAIVLGVG